MLGFTATAQAAKPIKVKAGSTVRIKATTGLAEQCQLRAPGGKRTVATKGAGNLTFSFRASKRARPGKYRVAVRCGSDNNRFTVRLKAKKPYGKSRKLVGSRIRVTRSHLRSQDPGNQPLTADQALARAQAAWNEDGKADMAALFTGSGVCTDYAYTRRPDVVERIWVRGYANAMLDADPGVPEDWTAYLWNDLAQQAGLPVTTTPTVGAVVVYEAWDANPSGHVAIVDAVNADGTFNLSEMNGADGLGKVTERKAAVLPGMSFIPVS